MKTTDSSTKLIHKLTGLDSKLENFSYLNGETYDSVTLLLKNKLITAYIGETVQEDEEKEEGVPAAYSVYIIFQGVKNKIYKVSTDKVNTFFYDYDQYGDYYRGFIIGTGIFYEARYSGTYPHPYGKYTTAEDSPYLIPKIEKVIKVLDIV